VQEVTMSTATGPPRLRAVGLSASPGGARSKSSRLLAHALARFEALGHATTTVALSDLPADALLGRAQDEGLDRAQGAVRSADVLVVATPVYRATYSGLLKVFLDLLPHGALTGVVVVPVVTGGGLAHLLAIDHGVRPLVASLGAVVVSAGVYGTDLQFHDGEAEPELLVRVDRAVDEATFLARARALARTAPLLDPTSVAESEV
jgi:FMN reductase